MQTRQRPFYKVTKTKDSGRISCLCGARGRDPILGRAGAFPAPVHEITGSVYGLANAPRLWSSEVGKRLFAAGFRPHALDQMCFLHFDTDGVLDCIVLMTSLSPTPRLLIFPCSPASSAGARHLQICLGTSMTIHAACWSCVAYVHVTSYRAYDLLAYIVRSSKLRHARIEEHAYI